jgi:hypothetical protein
MHTDGQTNRWIMDSGEWCLIHNTSIISKLMNGPKKQECYTTLGFQGTNILAYWAHA